MRISKNQRLIVDYLRRKGRATLGEIQINAAPLTSVTYKYKSKVGVLRKYGEKVARRDYYSVKTNLYSLLNRGIVRIQDGYYVLGERV